jgi:ribosomal protein L11 methyltransferase
MAFGTGTHPTTKLCLLAVEEHCQPGDFVIDIGCGSGILSIAALRCGAASVLACDIDGEAIAAAQENLNLNQLNDKAHLIQGSLREVLPHCPSSGAPLVLANILAPILRDLLDAGLSELVAPSGTLIMSGILEDQLESILEKSDELHFQQLSIYEEKDWRAIALRKLEKPLE